MHPSLSYLAAALLLGQTSLAAVGQSVKAERERQILSAVERTCTTDWAKQADQLRQPWDELQGRKGYSKGLHPSGC
jgi:hypothetical protein